jgi:hypothetical protein
LGIIEYLQWYVSYMYLNLRKVVQCLQKNLKLKYGERRIAYLCSSKKENVFIWKPNVHKSCCQNKPTWKPLKILSQLTEILNWSAKLYPTNEGHWDWVKLSKMSPWTQNQLVRDNDMTLLKNSWESLQNFPLAFSHLVLPSFIDCLMTMNDSKVYEE